MQLRQILRALGKTYKGKGKIREILDKKAYRLPEKYYSILEYAYIEKLSVENIKNKLALSNTQYHSELNVALGKLEALISDSELREIIEVM